MVRKLLNLSLLIGLVLFALVICKTGLQQIINDFRAISPASFLILMLLSLIQNN